MTTLLNSNLRKNGRFTWQLGIRGALSWLFLLCTVLPFAAISYYSYHSISSALRENILVGDQQDAETLVNTLQNRLQVIPKDLLFLANFHALGRALQWQDIGEPYKTHDWFNQTRNAFYSFISRTLLYAQLQVLDENGQEQLVINQDFNSADAAFVVPQSKLQNQQDQPYFVQALRLKKGQVYISEIQLSGNSDNSQRAEWVIRFATPIIDKNDVTRGIVTLSVYAEALLDSVRQASLQGQTVKQFHYMLINQMGRYLYHPEYEQAFIKAATLSSDFPTLFADIKNNEQGYVVDQNFISTFRHLHLDENHGNYWILIKQTNKATALQQVQHFKYLFTATIVGVIILVVLVAGWFTRRFLVQPLLTVNAHLQALSQGKLLAEDPSYQGSREILEIVLATIQLKNSIRETIAQANAISAGNYTLDIKPLSDQDQLSLALLEMTRQLREVTAKNVMQDWLKTGETSLHEKLSGEQDLSTLAHHIVNFLATYLPAQVGTFYVVDKMNPQRLKLLASYAYTHRKHLANEFVFGEGIIGQAALERQSILISHVPEDYIYIQSGLGESLPTNIIVTPFFYENNLKGVIELGAFQTFSTVQVQFLYQVLPNIGIAINSAQARDQMQELLHQSQLQAEELQSQTEELQTQAEELQSQQEELRQTNEELETRTRDLERQKEAIREKNATLEKTQLAIEAKAKELALASQYKSEFLANMSHELRTPLNSLLILAQLLAENKAGNLTEKQIEYAQTICSAGADLLALINDILDLSKVEAGKVEMNTEDFAIAELVKMIEQKFRHVADEKKLLFNIMVAKDTPPILRTDLQRLIQILNNLLANAFKFTSEGEVLLDIRKAGIQGHGYPECLESIKPESLSNHLAFSVADTGIGIPKDKQSVIFEAFQQADGTTSRRYGGTGLGLSISRQLAKLLGGEIQLCSDEGKGSTFTLYIPSFHTSVDEAAIIDTSVFASVGKNTFSGDFLAEKTSVPYSSSQEGENESNLVVSIESLPDKVAGENLSDDRDNLQLDDKFILIIEDDRKFSRILVELAHERDFKCLLAENGQNGLELAENFKPNAIILDVGLPKIDGWTVMEQLKHNPETRHIPVHFMSGQEHSVEARKMGAIGYLLKPVSMGELAETFKKIEEFIAKTIKNLLVVVDSETRRREIIDLISGNNVEATVAPTLAQAYQYLQFAQFDCIVIDVHVEQGVGVELLEQLHREERLSHIPVVLYADRELTAHEEEIVQRCTDSLTIKSVRTPERLLDETTLFLHQISTKLTSEKRNMLRMVHDKEAILVGKRVLIVDDDIRNTFALATVLEDKEMEIIVAKNGKEALALLEQQPIADIILMDIMMPEMDGYEAMRQIRAQPRFRKLPIIALTAKAMKGDKAKCIEAGANDYLAKPVNTDKLLSLMRVWLYR